MRVGKRARLVHQRRKRGGGSRSPSSLVREVFTKNLLPPRSTLWCRINTVNQSSKVERLIDITRQDGGFHRLGHWK
jgi:hypothetical protein